MNRTSWVRVLTCALPLALLLPTTVEAKSKRVKAPKPTASERKEIRRLMVQVGRGRHEAKRGQAATALGRYGPKAKMAIPALVNALKDWKTNVACAAAHSLGKVGVHSKPAVKGLLRALTKGRTVDVRKAAAQGLGMIGPNATAALPSLLRALENDDAGLRREAAQAVGKLGPKAKKHAPARLSKLLEDPNKRVRVAAAISLIRLGDRRPELVQALIKAVKKSNRFVLPTRHAACEALGELGPAAASAVTVLAECVLEEQARVNAALPYAEQRKKQHTAFRKAAAIALGKIGPKAKAALPALEEACDEPELRAAAKRAIERIGT